MASPIANSTPLVTARRPNSRVVVPIARPAGRKTAIPNPPLVNWRLVSLAGALAWLVVLGVVVGAWAIGDSNNSHETPIAKAVPAPIPVPAVAEFKATEKNLFHDLPTNELAHQTGRAKAVADVPAAVAKAQPANLPAAAKAKAPEEPALNQKQLEAAEAAVAAQFARPANAPAVAAKGKPEADDLPPALKVPEKTQCGTAVNFLTDPSQAMAKAAAENKLLFVVHVSGDFEDPGFT